MRRKDYLRGLGMGILVTVLILTIAGGNRMTDSEIRARAMELGMVDGQNTTLDEVRESTVDESQGEGTKDEKEVSVSGTDMESVSEDMEGTDIDNKESAEAGKEDSDVESSEASEAEATTESSAASETETATEAVTITVVRGDSSVSVSRDLEAAGMVDSAKEFDAYLCNNGYDKRISVGTFTIQPGSSYEEIAKIITGSK